MTAPLAPLGAGAFADLMAPLGPFEPAPRLAVAVSGGADSMSLALLANGWARSRDGAVLGLIVDHGLRDESAAEARLTQERLATQGIAAEILTLTGLRRGPAIAARARDARHAALAEACRARGILHLLLAHHANDQAETIVMRRLAGSGPDGLAGMAALVEKHDIRLLRPLLGVAPGRLRATLRAAGIGWVEDPSNRDPASQRARVRAARDDEHGDGPATRDLGAAAAAHAERRAEGERAAARELACRASLHPEGFAVLTPGPLSPRALGALLRMLGGKALPPASRKLSDLAAKLRPATLGGVRIMPAGRAGPAGTLLLLREAAAMAPPVPLARGGRWDGRFVVTAVADAPPDAAIGPVGPAAAGLRRAVPRWPSAVLQTLPAVLSEGKLFAVPYLCYAEVTGRLQASIAFRPPEPACCAAFHGQPDRPLRI